MTGGADGRRRETRKRRKTRKQQTAAGDEEAVVVVVSFVQNPNFAYGAINRDRSRIRRQITLQEMGEKQQWSNEHIKYLLETTKSSSVNSDDLAHDMRQALQYLIKGKEGPTVAECYEKLKLVGLDPVDPLFLAAFHIFGVSTGMREAWMTLPDIPEVLRGWIVMTATSLGLIKQ
ncbi:hypothetical protein E3N88_03351 [Mikania micrantha]|uniref:Uncharacterized protein n=1 Tax=Mikania micrantha TaxID=192012 RepID=A0A5N6Q6B3_9ASTR|nr:hypothetical protein E3N88_03351 [Mikania micrantha]